MNVQYIKDAVKRIQDISGDDEAAHSYEDRLYVEFIHYVAEHGSSELSEMANEVLKTNDMNFSRWCA